MTDYIPAPSGSTDTAAPQVTTPNENTTQTTTPQVETPAGQPQADAPAGNGNEQSAASDPKPDQSQEDQPKTWKEKRQERNRQRWQEYKEAKAILPQRLAALEQEVARLRSGGPPDLSKVTDPDDSIAKRAAWEVRQQQTADAEARLQAERENAAKEHQGKLWNAWTEQMEDARARIPDFDKVALRPDNPIHERMVPYIVESEKGADIVYWLGENPTVARDLAQKFQSDPAQALIELGRIEARMSAPQPRQVSTAPKPAPTLSGGVNPLAFDAQKAGVDDMQAQLKKAGIIR